MTQRRNRDQRVPGLRRPSTTIAPGQPGVPSCNHDGADECDQADDLQQPSASRRRRPPGFRDWRTARRIIAIQPTRTSTTSQRCPARPLVSAQRGAGERECRAVLRRANQAMGQNRTVSSRTPRLTEAAGMIQLDERCAGTRSNTMKGASRPKLQRTTLPSFDLVRREGRARPSRARRTARSLPTHAAACSHRAAPESAARLSARQPPWSGR